MEQNRLSLEDMFTKYPDQWLFIVDCEHDESTQLVSGIVAAHSPSRDVCENQFNPSRNYLLRNFLIPKLLIT